MNNEDEFNRFLLDEPLDADKLSVEIPAEYPISHPLALIPWAKLSFEVEPIKGWGEGESHRLIFLGATLFIDDRGTSLTHSVDRIVGVRRGTVWSPGECSGTGLY